VIRLHVASVLGEAAVTRRVRASLSLSRKAWTTPAAASSRRSLGPATVAPPPPRARLDASPGSPTFANPITTAKAQNARIQTVCRRPGMVPPAKSELRSIGPGILIGISFRKNHLLESHGQDYQIAQIPSFPNYRENCRNPRRASVIQGQSDRSIAGENREGQRGGNPQPGRDFRCLCLNGSCHEKFPHPCSADDLATLDAVLAAPRPGYGDVPISGCDVPP